MCHVHCVCVRRECLFVYYRLCYLCRYLLNIWNRLKVPMTAPIFYQLFNSCYLFWLFWVRLFWIPRFPPPTSLTSLFICTLTQQSTIKVKYQHLYHTSLTIIHWFGLCQKKKTVVIYESLLKMDQLTIW